MQPRAHQRSPLSWRREGSRNDRGELRHAKEFLGKVPKGRVPQGAFWEAVWAAWDCRTYGKREYWGMPRNMPEGWSAIDACMSMPVDIKFADGSPHIHGYWIVDLDQADCKGIGNFTHPPIVPTSENPMRSQPLNDGTCHGDRQRSAKLQN